jgi:hypothetical protein
MIIVVTILGNLALGVLVLATWLIYRHLTKH